MFWFASVPVGRLFGVPILIHWSVPAGILALTLAFWRYFCGRGFDVGVWRLATVLGLLTVVALLIVMHEMAHALVARFWGIPAQGIYLHVFGGVALLGAPDGTELKPGQEMAVAAAGPASNVLCFLAALPAAYVIHNRSAAQILAAVAGVNLGMAIFNLLPIWPLDGGQLFRAFLVLIHLRPRLADWITLAVSLLVGCPCLYGAWVSGNFWTFSIMLVITASAVIFLAF